MPTISATHSAPSNIAVIKYWGKKDVKLNTPINSSVSVTMNQDDLKAITTIVASPAFGSDRLWLNGVEENVESNGRVQDVLREIRARCGSRADSSGAVVPREALATWRVHIVSRNTFPTAAGLASSAAGYACLVDTLADVYGVKETYTGELSTIARQGSGSACRSLYGGFVRWQAGSAEHAATARDSMAVQVATEAHWPELVILIAVVSDKKKDTGSTDGMGRSVATSALLAHRASSVVPARLAAIEAAYLARDFPAFARICMADSNQFHATCMDTYPPIFYMNDVSKRVIGLVHALNGESGKGAVGLGAGVVAAYTFDAGPNAVIFTTKLHAAKVLAALLAHFPPDASVDLPFVSSPSLEAEAHALIAAGSLPPVCTPAPGAASPGTVRHVYVTSAGDGPRVLTQEPGAPLADPQTGLPLVTATSDDGVYGKAL